jgi:hypothetical protein
MNPRKKAVSGGSGIIRNPARPSLTVPNMPF